MLHMLLFLLFTMPLAYRVLLALFDPQRLHEQESLQVIQMIEKNMGSLERDPLLTQIGNELLVNQEQEAEFYLVPSSLVNAVALPNGSILIWQGLLDRIRRDEHKVAAVLAHEISHLYHDHHLRRLYWMVLLQFVLGFLSRGLLSNIFRQISFRTLFSGYSRFHERQADDTALDIMLNSRFNPYKMIQLFSDFEHLDTVHYNFFSTHPSPTQRKLRILKQLQKIKEYSHQDTNVSDEEKTTDNHKGYRYHSQRANDQSTKNPSISPSLPESTNTET